MFHIIVNPIAGQGRSLIRLALLCEHLTNMGLAFEVFETKAPMEGYYKAYSLKNAYSHGIIAIGGDGTVQEIVAGLADAFGGCSPIPIPLAIFACGSGNDFVMSIEDKKRHAVSKYRKTDDRLAAQAFLDILLRRDLRRVDMISADGMAFLNIGNVGLDARIVRGALKHKKNYGQYSYLAAVYESIAAHENISLSIQIDGNTIQKDCALAAVCNGRYYGGGMPLAPCAEIDDGMITFCYVESLSRPEAMVLFPTLLFSLHTKIKKVHYIKCTKLNITIPPGETLCLDGNLYEKSGVVNFEIMPGALELFV